MPLGLVMKMELARHETRDTAGLALRCKDFRCLMVFFERNESHKEVSSLLKQRLFPSKILLRLAFSPIACACMMLIVSCVLLAWLSDLFAYKNKEYVAESFTPTGSAGFSLYDPAREFKRQKLSTNHWRITKLNRHFEYFGYPSLFVVPRTISDGKTLWRIQRSWWRSFFPFQEPFSNCGSHPTAGSK